MSFTPKPDPTSPISARVASAWLGLRKWWAGSKRRRNWIIAAAAVVVLAITGTIAGVSYSNHQAELTAAAEAKAAKEVKDARIAEIKAEAHDDARTTGEELLGEGATFSTDSIDYADADDALELEEALSALEKALDSKKSTTADLRVAYGRVSSAIRIIGDRPVPYDWAVSCSDDSVIKKSYPFATYKEAWASPVALTDCKPSGRKGDFPTDAQNAALASGAVSSIENMGILYGICASPGLNSYGQMESISDAQYKEIAGALSICPDHPSAAAIAPRVEAARLLAEGLANGTIFYGGARRVGVDIQPGTYVVEGELDGCYWERTDATGEIIDNNFISSGLRAQVTVRASDYSFSSSGCGQWRKQ